MTKSQKREIERIKAYMKKNYENKKYSIEETEKMSIIEENGKVRVSVCYMIANISNSYLIYIGKKGGLRCYTGKNFVNYITKIIY